MLSPGQFGCPVHEGLGISLQLSVAGGGIGFFCSPQSGWPVQEG